MDGSVLKDLFPSMFQRRLLLLVGLAGVAFAPMGFRLADLTLTRAGEARRTAEQKLVRRHWTPTTRGLILDRKDRVLAQDRPSYDVAVDFSVLSGRWAEEQAARLARRSAGARWRDLPPSEREARIAAVRALCEAHLERAWDELARASGVPRAEIDEKRREVVARVERMHAAIIEQRRSEEIAAYQSRGAEISAAEAEAIERRVTKPINEQQTPHVLLSRVTDTVGFSVRTLRETEVPLAPAGVGEVSGLIDADQEVPLVPGLHVADTGDRSYPFESVVVELDGSTLPRPVRREGTVDVAVDGVATHILGWIRDQVQAEDAAARAAALRADPSLAAAAISATGQDRGAYQAMDRVGHVGIERSFEPLLRGARGLREVRLDTGAEAITPAEPGRTVRLTIDVALQARVQAAMTPSLGLAVVQPWQHQDSAYMPEGTALNGAAVVLDVDTGQILAMVSTPSFTRAQMREQPETVFGDRVDSPFLNRAIAKSYTPGSIVKALVLTEALSRGNFRTEQRIACTGHLLPNQPNMYRCWIYKRFGTTHTAQLGHVLSGPEALCVSCNIFFYTLGRRLGPEGISAVFRDFGVGEGFGLGIGDEFPGQVGARGRDGSLRVRPEDAIQMAIGQGPVVWTPLHAADAYATLARGGVRVPPRLTESRALGATAPAAREIDLSPASVAESLDGLRLAVNDKRGTGHHITFDDPSSPSGLVEEPIFNAPGVSLWGKTGTADAPDQVIDPDADGPEAKEIVRAGDHSWFVVLVGEQNDRPKYAISVVMDFAGSGGKVSGPICNQIIHALIAEGYLSGVQRGAPERTAAENAG